MIWWSRAGLRALALALAFAVAPARAGIDQAYSKPETERTWSEIVNWAFGGEEPGRAHALIVGISQYDGIRNLDETRGDPERMRKFLLDDAGFDYVHVLTDEKVTMDRLRTLIQDDFRERVGPNDRFVFYWSGHGMPVEARSRQLGYLPLASSVPDRIASMLAMRDLLSWTDHIGAKQVLHVLDTCYSGLAPWPERLAAPRELTIAALNKPARHLLTATTGAEETIASREWAGGIFTDAFIAGARGEADRSGDGIVNMLELEDFVRDRVLEKSHLVQWPDEIKPKSYDSPENKGEFFFITTDKKREVAGADDGIAIEHGMPVKMGPSEDTAINAECAELDDPIRQHFCAAGQENCPTSIPGLMAKYDDVLHSLQRSLARFEDLTTLSIDDVDSPEALCSYDIERLSRLRSEVESQLSLFETAENNIDEIDECAATMQSYIDQGHPDGFPAEVWDTIARGLIDGMSQVREKRSQVESTIDSLREAPEELRALQASSGLVCLDSSAEPSSSTTAQ